MTTSVTNIKKAFGMPSVDGSHQYLFKSGEYGTIFQYWWRDKAGNYYRYTNAPEGSPDFDPMLGLPLLDPDQPLPEKTPAFFTAEGFKRHMAVPEGVEPTRNAAYNQNDGRNIWFEVASQKSTQFFYLDADVKENLDLYVQHQIRVVDAGLAKYRAFATEKFASQHPKDKITAGILILCDQGFYEPEELVDATVGDIEFVDQAVILLGRKFVCDLTFLDFLTSLVAMRSPTDPLFQFDTVHGTRPVGINYINAIFYTLKVSPKFLLCWNASHLFSRIVNRMAFQEIPPEDVEGAAFDELARTLSTRDDVHYLVDFKVRVALLRNYEKSVNQTESTPTVTKSLTRLMVDDFGVSVIRSDLSSLRNDEKEFSTWLHIEPMHDLSPEEEAMVAEELSSQSEETDAKEASAEPPNAGPASPEDAPEPSATPDDEAPQ